MKAGFQSRGRGYTIVEMTMTIAIVSVLATTFGVFLVKLLAIHEKDREEAYIREKLADICGAYADDLSIGSSFFRSNQTDIVAYRQETGGVSLETGRISRVAHMTSATNMVSRTIDLNVYAFEESECVLKLAQRVDGDPSLIALTGSNRVRLVSFKITPLKGNTIEDGDNWTSDAVLGCLAAEAEYEIEDSKGELETKTARVERLVRLWNRE